MNFDAAKSQILEWLSDAIHTPIEKIDTRIPFAELGLDSLDAVHMIATIESIIGRELPEDVMRRVRNLDDIFDMMRERMNAA